MSELRVSSLKNASSATANITLDTAGNATVGGTLAMGGSFLRNRIINGDMRIDQRNAGASVTPTNGQYLVDRFYAGLTQSSKFSAQQDAGAVTPPVGFTDYLGCTSLSAYSVGSGDAFFVQQPIEGLNVADLAWGTANARTVTLSFWVQSSLTGTFGGSIMNNGVNRAYPFSYSISSANTWTYVTITIAGDTSGTWLTTNGVGLRVTFSLGMGSTLSATAGSWAAGNFLSATGATSVVGTNGATFYLTGVQLEVGSVATPFERRQYGQELALCQRYYFASDPANGEGDILFFYINATNLGGRCSFPTTMRSAPTLTFCNYTTTNRVANIGGGTVTGVTSSLITTTGFGNAQSGGTFSVSGGQFHIRASAEL